MKEEIEANLFEVSSDPQIAIDLTPSYKRSVKVVLKAKHSFQDNVASLRGNRFKKNFNQKNERYHTEICQRFSHIKPGKLSNNLRMALGIRSGDFPLIFQRMRMLGYPPGWLENLKSLNLVEQKNADCPEDNMTNCSNANESDGTAQFSNEVIASDENVENETSSNSEICSLNLAVLQEKQKDLIKALNKPSQTIDLDPIESNEVDLIENEATTPVAEKDFLSNINRHVKIKSEDLGTPILKFSPFDGLPTRENFQQGVSDVINFENLPSSTGKYKNMEALLKKVRRKLCK